jgi:hypothetical protein
MKLYKDKVETFQCELEIEGASNDNSQVRMVLEFDDGTNQLWKGTLNESGDVKVKIPALKNISAKGGKATLEVIAESTFFTPWESDFEIEQSKTVSIKEVRLSTDTEKKVTITKPILQEKKETPSSKQLTVEINKKTSDKSKKMIREALQKFASLPSKERAELIKAMRTYKPSKTIANWSNRVFIEKNEHSKLCTYLVEENMKT